MDLCYRVVLFELVLYYSGQVFEGFGPIFLGPRVVFVMFKLFVNIPVCSTFCLLCLNLWIFFGSLVCIG